MTCNTVAVFDDPPRAHQSCGVVWATGQGYTSVVDIGGGTWITRLEGLARGLARGQGALITMAYSHRTGGTAIDPGGIGYML